MHGPLWFEIRSIAAAVGLSSSGERYQLVAVPTEEGRTDTRSQACMTHFPPGNQSEVQRDTGSSLGTALSQVACSSAAHSPGPSGQGNQGSAEKSNYHGRASGCP